MLRRLLFLVLLTAIAPGVHGATIVDIAYGEGPSQRLDICRSDAPGSRPAVIVIHGGGWQAGDKQDVRWFCELASRDGIVAVAINYRLANGDTDHRWPAQADDVFAAQRWVLRHAGELGIDTARICMLGGSAGAHLALYAAFSTGLRPRPACVVDMFGPTDLTSWPGVPVRTLFGTVTPAELADRRRAMSPFFLVDETAPPVMVVYGETDAMVPVAQSTALIAALRNAGIATQVVALQGGHEFHLVPEPIKMQTLRAALDFIHASTGKPRPPAR